jgi:hypothetical protein
VVLVADLQRHDGVVVVREIAVGVELDGFAVPFFGGRDVVFAELEEAHGFVSEGVIGIVAEGSFEESFGVFGTLVVDKDVGADSVDIGFGDGTKLKGCRIDGNSGVHPERAETALLDVVLKGTLELVEVAEGVLGGGDGVFAFDEEPGVVVEVIGIFLFVGDFDEVGERPGFGVEDGALLLFVVVGRGVVDFEQSGERKEAILAEVEDVVRAGLAEEDIFFVDVRVLVELGEAFVEPKGNPGGLAEHVVGVFVIDGGEGMLAFSVEAEKNVVFVGGAHEVAGEIELAFGEVGLGFEGLESLAVLQSEDDDGRTGIVGRAGHEDVEDRTHLLELASEVAGLFFVGVGEDDEVRALDFEPVIVGVACRGSEGDAEEKQGRDVLAHSSPRVYEPGAGRKRNYGRRSGGIGRDGLILRGW